MNECFEDRLLTLRMTELKAREQIQNVLLEKLNEPFWKAHGYPSLRAYCEGDLSYSSHETRDLLAKLGHVVTTAELRSGDPSIQLRIDKLVAWRKRTSKEAGFAAYRVLTNKTLLAIAERAPSSLLELSELSGIGPAKLAAYGEDVLRVIDTTVEPSDLN
jgi:superfamily II DNA helicase RecQ